MAKRTYKLIERKISFLMSKIFNRKKEELAELKRQEEMLSKIKSIRSKKDKRAS